MASKEEQYVWDAASGITITRDGIREVHVHKVNDVFTPAAPAANLWQMLSALPGNPPSIGDPHPANIPQLSLEEIRVRVADSHGAAKLEYEYRTNTPGPVQVSLHVSTQAKQSVFAWNDSSMAYDIPMVTVDNNQDNPQLHPVDHHIPAAVIRATKTYSTDAAFTITDLLAHMGTVNLEDNWPLIWPQPPKSWLITSITIPDLPTTLAGGVDVKANIEFNLNPHTWRTDVVHRQKDGKPIPDPMTATELGGNTGSIMTYDQYPAKAFSELGILA